MRFTLVLGIALLASAARAQDTTGAVHGTVLSSDNQQPLAFATVTLDSTGVTVFADSSGSFRIGKVAAGPHHLRARELGYTPLDTTVEVHAAQTVELVLALARIPYVVPYVLPPVAITGRNKCRIPGLSDSTMGADVVTLATQLVVNAQRVHLLEAQQPYEYWIESTISRHSEYRPERNGEEVDTLVFRSDVRHAYRPGDIIDPRLVGRRLSGREERNVDYIYLPELEDLAEPSFMSHHCFTFGGVDTVAGEPELRIDFRPLDKMRSADAEGSFFLDPTRFVAKRAVLRMTKGDHEVPPIWHLEAFIWYREIAPLIVVEDSARYTLEGGTALTGGEVKQVEQQRVIQYHPRRSTSAR